MRALALLLLLASPAAAAPALAPAELWFSPTDDVTQHGTDFHEVFAHPELWRDAAAHARGVSIAVRYLLTTSPDTVRRELAAIRALHLRLDVVVPGLGVDKHICGDGVEGVVWPGESANAARELKALGVEPFSFTLDLPLTDGHILTRRQNPKACELSVQDAAAVTARTVAVYRAAFPAAAIVDVEVPTGIPVEQWSAILEEWLTDYQQASGRQFDAVMMDAWWKFPWRPTVAATAVILARHGIRSGILIDESGAGTAPASDWVGAARRHVCELRQAGIRLDYLVVASWSNMNVKSVPERDPSTLSGLLDWIAGRPDCPP